MTQPCFVLILPWELHHTGGVNQVLINLYRQIDKAGEMRPLFLISRWSAFRPVDKMTNGFNTIYLRFREPWTKRNGMLSLVKWFVVAPYNLLNMWWFYRRHRVCAFNFHYPTLSVLLFALLRSLRLYSGELILSYHGADLISAKSGGLIELFLWRLIFRNVTAIVACSRAFAIEVEQFVGKKTRIYAIQNGLDIEHFICNVDRSVTPLAILGNRKFILSVATWEQKKGLDILVCAFATLRNKYPGLALVLVGRSAEAAVSLKEYVNDLKIEEDVFFYESVPHSQIGMFLENATLFCLPSRDEPFGIALLEAGAYRLPVVASRVGGIQEIVTDGETGILVPANNANALTVALDQILSDPEFGRKLGEALYRRVVTHFTWERAYKEYRALLPSSINSS